MWTTALSIALESVGVVMTRGHFRNRGLWWRAIHPDVSAPSARQGFLPGATRIPAVRHGTEATIESPSTPSTRRAAPASFHTILLARPLRFWSTFYVDNRFIHRSRERRRGHDTRTLQESGTVVESDTPGCKCAFGATRIPAWRDQNSGCPSRHGGHDRVAKHSFDAACGPRVLPYYPLGPSPAILVDFLCGQPLYPSLSRA